jgi:cell division GTPase FtsZ
MKPKSEISGAIPEAAAKPAVKIFGVGGAGVALLDALNAGEFAGAEFAAINTDAASLAVSPATVKIHL